MRRIAVSGAVVLGLVACSGDNSSVTEFENPPHEVVSIYDLGKCTDSRRGEVIFVEDLVKMVLPLPKRRSRAPA